MITHATVNGIRFLVKDTESFARIRGPQASTVLLELRKKGGEDVHALLRRDLIEYGGNLTVTGCALSDATDTVPEHGLPDTRHLATAPGTPGRHS